jgi:c-di-GMP-binding flagellar brake protein YcgR
MWIVFLVLLLLLAGAVVYLWIAGGGCFPWLQFYTKGKEAGFSFREINLLARLAVESRLENPSALFWSIRQLDRSIEEQILKMRANSQEDQPEANRLLARLFELRKKVEFDLPKYKPGIKSSHDIVLRQRLKLMIPGKSPFVATMVNNQPRYFAVSYPQGSSLPGGVSWKGKEVVVCFWRADDAGYSFHAKVIDVFLDRDYPILHITHSDSLVRIQSRKSVRAVMDHPAMAFPLASIDHANESIEESPGLRCRIKNLSEGGIAVLVGGSTKVGLPLKVQLKLAGKTIVMCGVIRRVSYNSRKNLSILHIQAASPGAAMKNRILAYVYNLFGEQETVQRKARPRAG